MRLHLNTSAAFDAPLIPQDQAAFGPSVVAQVRERLARVPHRPTPLHGLPGLAASLRVRAIHVKDESERSSLGSFKALGGAHAVIRLVLREAGRHLDRSLAAADLDDADVRAVAAGLTITCATDGNHGRAVAAGAALAGCACTVFIHAGVSEPRAQAISAQGAHVVRVDGNYDDAVAAANREARERGWHVVSDTSWPGYEEIPTWVMQGYLVMASEAIEQARTNDSMPTHVFLQAGVGGYAAAVAAHMALVSGLAAPRIVVVEPERAACLLASAMAGRLTRVAPQEPTLMAMLECYEPSLIAWRILERRAHAFMAIGESEALRAMRALALPKAADPFVLAGESGGAGLAGLMAAAASARAREQLGLGPDSVVMVFNTEGATDQDRYRELLARAEQEA